MLTVQVGGDIELEEIQVPSGVVLLELGDLSKRYREALKSTDRHVRGWGAGRLARLSRYSTDNLTAIANLLEDKDDWVRLNAIHALGTFGKKAEPYLAVLRTCLPTGDDQFDATVGKTIEGITSAKDAPLSEKEHQATLAKIARFCQIHSGSEQTPD